MDTGATIRHFTAPRVEAFIANNPTAVAAASRLGERGWRRLAARWIRENSSTP
jgi:hypothetical protein